MSNPEFLIELLENLPRFCIFLVLNMVALFVLLRNKIHSFIDPSFMMALMASCANTVVCFLFSLKLISNEKFLYFVLSESLFWFGFLFINNGNEVRFSYKKKRYTSSDLFKMYMMIFFLHVSVTIFNYMIVGIPVFQDSRFVIRQNPFTAISGRMLALPSSFLILYSYHIILNHKRNIIKRIYVAICFLILILLSFLSGSKGFILQYVFLYFAYVFFYKKKIIHVSFKYAILIMLSPLPVIAIYYSASDTIGIGLLLYRFIASGDGYWQGFVYDTIDTIDNTAYWYERMFSFILGPLDLISPNAKIPIGTLILNQINPGTVGTLEGPNSRVPIFTWALFEWNGIIVSFLLGLLSRCFAYGKFCRVSFDIVGLSVVFFLYKLSLSMITDPTMFGASLIDFGFGVILFNMLSHLFFHDRGHINFKFK